MDQFPSNSKFTQKAEPPEQKPVARVTTGGVSRRKKPLSRRMAESFTGDDTKGVLEYVFVDVIVPAAKALVADAVVEGVERKLFGEARSRGRGFRPPSGPSGWTNYRPGLGAPTPPPAPPGLSRQARAADRFDELVFDARVDAQQVLNGMYAQLQEFDAVQVRTFLELCGEPWDYPDMNRGWTDLTGADIRRARGGGYYIALPRTEPLN